jgi:hypothetical protein
VTKLRIVDELPKTEGRGREKKYDFTELFKTLLQSGKAAELVSGEDFECSPASMKQQLYKEAKDAGLKASIRGYTDEDETDIVVFAVITQEQADKDKAEREAKERERKAKNKQSPPKQENTQKEKEPATA